ncbi:MAG: methyltransferase domain-containing protein [Sphingobium sp.]|nr:methyltransferase domain-containing protein [Sphingobium sp.]
MTPSSTLDTAGLSAENPIVPGRKVDFGKAADDYARYRAGFPERFFERLSIQLDLEPIMRALDIGTGTGTVARGLAGLGLAVEAVDPSAPMMEQARVLDQVEGVAVAYQVGTAEALPLPDARFDLATAGQCWHWFDQPRAAAEAIRVLKPGGVLVLCHFDWLPIPGNVVEATEALIMRYNPGWRAGGGTGLHGQNLADLSVVGFRDIETASFDIDQPYSHEAWRGRIRASAGIKATLDEIGVARFDADHAALLAKGFPQEPLLVPHRVFWAIARKPA